MAGWMDRWMDGWIDGWMDGWVDGYFNPICLAAPCDSVKLPDTIATGSQRWHNGQFFQQVGAQPHSLQRSVHCSL
jgi:hypothetical protein